LEQRCEGREPRPESEPRRFGQRILDNLVRGRSGQARGASPEQSALQSPPHRAQGVGAKVRTRISARRTRPRSGAKDQRSAPVACCRCFRRRSPCARTSWARRIERCSAGVARRTVQPENVPAACNAKVQTQPSGVRATGTRDSSRSRCTSRCSRRNRSACWPGPAGCVRSRHRRLRRWFQKSWRAYAGSSSETARRERSSWHILEQ
jgi:hypothetical protein